MLYLIPTPIGSGMGEFPAENIEIIKSLKYFVVEDVRSARRFLSSLKAGINIDSLSFSLLNEHTRVEEMSSIAAPMLTGNDVGLMSEAGLPCIADPGRQLVRMANASGIRVKPLVGPSSLMMALMASGASGQNFRFNGYIPVKAEERTAKIKHMESEAYREDISEIFIETPYRNSQLLSHLLRTLRPETMLTVAQGILTQDESLKTMPVSAWKGDLPKIPAVFIISRP